MYATTVLKDVPYSYVFMLYCILVWDILEAFRKKDRDIYKYLIALGAAGLLLMLLRKNGIYVVVPTGLVLLAAGRKIFKKNRLLLAVVIGSLLIPVGMYKGYEDWFLPRLGIMPGSIAEMFSIPFQQTARYARDYGDEVTEEEKEVIDKVLDYDYLAELYNPDLSDPIKDMYRYPERSELIEYFKVWFRQFLRHPGVYIQATMNNVYALFYPGVDNTYIFFDLLEEYGYNNFEQPQALKGYREAMESFTNAALRFPGLNLLNNMALWVWLFFIEFFYCWKAKRWTAVLTGIPVWISVLVCIASPVIIGHPRYVFPIMLAAIVLFVPCIYVTEEKADE